MLVLQRMVEVIETALLEANDAHDAEADRRRAERDDFTPGIQSDSPPTRFDRLHTVVLRMGSVLRGRREGQPAR